MKRIFFLIIVSLLLIGSCSHDAYDAFDDSDICCKVKKGIVTISAETAKTNADIHGEYDIEKECLKMKYGRKKEGERWLVFCDTIEGFTYVKGYEYELLIETKPFEHPLMDASCVEYKLIKVLSKTLVKVEE